MSARGPVPGTRVTIRTGATSWPGGGPNPYAGRSGVVVEPIDWTMPGDDPFPVRVLLDDGAQVRAAVDEVEAVARPSYPTGRAGRGVLTVTVAGAAGGVAVRVTDEHTDGTRAHERFMVPIEPDARHVALVLSEVDDRLIAAGYYRASRWADGLDGEAVAAVEPLPALDVPSWAAKADVLAPVGGEGGAVVVFERPCGAVTGNDASVYVVAEVDLTAGTVECGPPRVVAHVDTDALTAAQARDVARFLTDAAGVVEAAGGVA